MTDVKSKIKRSDAFVLAMVWVQCCGYCCSSCLVMDFWFVTSGYVWLFPTSVR